MEFLKSTIKIGLEKPVGFLHISDTHLPKDDPADEKNGEFRAKAEADLIEALEYADRNGLYVLHTGDIMTYWNEKNLKTIDRLFGGRDYIFAVGNHDFCHEGGYFDDPENIERNIKLVAPHFPHNLVFYAKVIGGVNVVSVLNGFFRISEGQLEMLRAEVAKGYPVILCMHVPFFTQEHAAARLARGNCAHLLAPTEEYLACYPEKFQFQRADEMTLRAMEYIKSEPAIKAIIAGHTHMNWEEVLDGGTIQIVTAGTFEGGYAREITVE